MYYFAINLTIMKTSTLKPQCDPMGAAISDFQHKGKAGKLRVLSSMFDEDSIEVSYLFRTVDQMPKLEKKALEMVRGNVLDVGAGSGCHALALQRRFRVTAIDISMLSRDVMRERGVRNAHCINFYDLRLEGSFDTILLLMNGTGIIGDIGNIPVFFARMRNLLAHGGQVLIDSSDLKYLYEMEDGSYDIDPSEGYYGQVDYQMVYGDVKGESFNWLYLDFETLKMHARNFGFNCELVERGDHYDYLAKLSVK